MKKLIKQLIEPFVILLIIILIIIIIIPWKNKEVAPDQNIEIVEKNDIIDDILDNKQKKYASTQKIAILFGGRIRRKAVIKKDPPEYATWIKVIGFVVEKDRKKHYLFKDSRTNMVLSLAVGEMEKGWKLIDVKDSEYILNFEKKQYIISKRIGVKW